MNHGILPTTFFLLALAGFTFSLPAKALTDHLIISQVQVAGVGAGHANDEFVELYNPTGSSFDLTNLRLTRTNSTGGGLQNLVASFSGILATGHYYLIAHPEFTTISVSPDKVYTASSSGITTGSTIILYTSDHTTVIDKVGFGAATNFEASPAPDPTAGQSLVRATLQDTDNNSIDFTVSTSPTPHNTSFITSTPTLIPTSEPTSTPEPTSIPEITPTSEPTPTAKPTPITTPEPTAEVITPTLTPTSAPIPTIVPTTTPQSTHHKEPEHFFKKFINTCHRYIQQIHWPRFNLRKETPKHHR